VLILGIDTSDRQGSVALLESEGAQPAQSAEREEAKTLELASLGEGHSSELLVPAIDGLLARHRVQKRSLSLIAVAGGPGSFTGLRVAVATAKGLAEALAIPLVAVSVLEAVALTSGVRGRVVAAVDAQRGEVFFGEYIVGGERAERVREGIAAIENFLSELDSGSPLTIITPDASLAARLRHSADLIPTISEVRRPTAEDIARIAQNKFLSGERADVASLDANYLRRSDAEIVAARKPQV
jgi:tRNA threonylcarbamoyladenosine biosynthesis protein TsaB